MAKSSLANIAIIDGHPDPDPARFVHALAATYASGAHDAGHNVRRTELAKMDFPLIRTRSQWSDEKPGDAIAGAQADIAWANHLLILYPLWLGDVPALLKAFLEQVARPGFALREGDKWPVGLLKGKSARIVVTMGMPSFFYRFYFGAHSVKSLERNILKLAGIRSVVHSLIGNVEGSADARENWLSEMFALGRLAE
jgi:putative NADPH-quinone reductase